MSLVTEPYRLIRVELIQRAVYRQLAQLDDLRNALRHIATGALQRIYQIQGQSLAGIWGSKSATLESGLTESLLSEV